MQLSQRACADSRELDGAAASQQAHDLAQQLDTGDSEPDCARLPVLQLSRRACGLALGTSLLSLQAGPAHAVLTAPPGAHQSLLHICAARVFVLVPSILF